MSTVLLRHNKIDLALHCLQPGDGRPLLLLHGLGERSPDHVAPPVDRWPGPVHALDFTGHGASSKPVGGGYSAELLMADVDVALGELGQVTLLGRGLGAYVAVLVAGARPGLVHGAILDDGPGLHGGPAGPSSSRVLAPAPGPKGSTGPPDPYALVELSTDVRPRDYVIAFARHAADQSDGWPSLAVVARPRPEWLVGVMEHLMLAPTTLEQAIAIYAG